MHCLSGGINPKQSEVKKIKLKTYKFRNIGWNETNCSNDKSFLSASTYEEKGNDGCLRLHNNSKWFYNKYDKILEDNAKNNKN